MGGHFAVLHKFYFNGIKVHSLFYAIFGGFEGFFKTGLYTKFNERLGGLIFEGVYTRGISIRALR